MALSPTTSREASGAAGGVLAGAYPDPDFAALIGFYGTTPTAQHAAIPDAAGGATVDAEARAAVNAALDALRDIGIVAA